MWINCLTSQPAFQRWFTGESTSGTMVESTWIMFRFCKLDQRWYCDVVSPRNHDVVSPLKIVTLFHRLTFSMGELRSFCRRWINVELCVDFANWINVDNTTLFHRRTFNMMNTQLYVQLEPSLHLDQHCTHT